MVHVNVTECPARHNDYEEYKRTTKVQPAEEMFLKRKTWNGIYKLARSHNKMFGNFGIEFDY